MAHTQHHQTAEIVRAQVREAVVDHEAFSQRVKPCQLASCRATCCHDGVYLSSEEQSHVSQLVGDHPESFADLTTPIDELFETTASGRIKTRAVPAPDHLLADDFPAHFPRTRCAFLDSIGRCTIQRHSMENGFSDWYHKPLTCWLHPILIKPGNHHDRPLLTLPSPANDPQKSADYPGFASCTHCGRPDNDGTPAHTTLAPELELLSLISGRNLTRELSAPSA